MTKRFATLFICLFAALAVSACQTIAEKRKIDYKSTRTLPSLDIPPDLSAPEGSKDAQDNAPSSATYSGFVGDKSSQATSATGSDVLPDFDNMRLQRDGQIRWLTVKATPEQLWPRVREFILSRGLIIDKENQQTGVIETDWAENRANVGSGTQRLLAKSLGTLYSTGLRDKYRIRLERGLTPDTTEIYLSHRGMEEVIVERNPGTEIGATMWQARPSDPSLEAEMLRLLMVSLGAKEDKANSMVASLANTPAPLRAKLSGQEGDMSLILQDDFERAWRRVGLSLDRTSFTVQDRDRSKGIYYVRYIDPDKAGKKKGFFSRLFSKKEKEATNEYQIHVTSDAGTSQVQVLNKDGTPEKTKTGERILTLLYEQLK